MPYHRVQRAVSIPPLSELVETTTYGPCILWDGAINSGGYGSMWDPLKRKIRGSHRVFYEAEFGEIPPGLVIDHICQVKRCVNPYHLQAITQADNVKKVWSDTHCVNGHEWTEDTLYVNKQGNRACRECRRLSERRRRGVE